MCGEGWREEGNRCHCQSTHSEPGSQTTLGRKPSREHSCQARTPRRWCSTEVSSWAPPLGDRRQSTPKNQALPWPAPIKTPTGSSQTTPIHSLPKRSSTVTDSVHSGRASRKKEDHDVDQRPFRLSAEKAVTHASPALGSARVRFQSAAAIYLEKWRPNSGMRDRVMRRNRPRNLHCGFFAWSST